MQPDVQYMYIFTNSIRENSCTDVILIKQSSVWSGGAQDHMISAIGLQLSGYDLYIPSKNSTPSKNPNFFMNSRDCHDDTADVRLKYLPKFQLVCQTGKRVGMLEPHHQNREIAKTSGADLNEETQDGAAGWLCHASGHHSREVFVPIPGTFCRLSLPWSCVTENLLHISILLRKVRKGPQWTGTHQFIIKDGWYVIRKEFSVGSQFPI